MGINTGITISKVRAGTGIWQYETSNEAIDDIKTYVQRELAALKKNGVSTKYYTGTLDGKYGSGTRNAVTDFQRDNDRLPEMTIDGKVGRVTIAAVETAYADRSNYNAYGDEISVSLIQNPTSAISDEGYLARIIYGEARNIDADQANVAQVVLNRKASSRFPNQNTIKAVCSQPGQFTCIGNVNTGDQPSAKVLKPNRTESEWQNALRKAKIACGVSTGSLGSSLLKKQMYFRSASLFDSKYTTSGGREYFDGDEIRDVVRVVSGTTKGNVYFAYKNDPT